jgi:tetratricopeptide (TPR) repeat protein
MLSRFRADRARRRAATALRAGRFDEAAESYEHAIKQTPNSSAVWFNLGLAHKFRRDWPASLEANLRAAQLDPHNKEALWNLGVAATALRDWERAAWAWDSLGFEHGEKPGPPHLNYGLAPVRLNPESDGDGEVVWGWRIDPCRIRIHNVPLEESGHRWDDVVLHDVVARGERQFLGQTYSVFDELLRMDPSTHETHKVDVICPAESDSEELSTLFYENGLGAEDWSAKVQWICATCSLGSPHAHRVGDEEPTPVRTFGLAGPTGSSPRTVGAVGSRRSRSGDPERVVRVVQLRAWGHKGERVSSRPHVRSSRESNAPSSFK